MFKNIEDRASRRNFIVLPVNECNAQYDGDHDKDSH